MRNIVITGGELFNKGAQAMTFVAVDELKKRFPGHEIYLLSEMDRRRPKEERDQYAFRFTGWYPIKYARAQSDPILRLACKLKNGAEFRACEELYRNCDLMVDISGYGLGSNWDINQLTTYADHLEFARAYHIPMVLMPQSFGPFDFQGERKTVGERFPELLRTAKIICAREQQGYDDLVSRYQLNRVLLLPDLVLNNKSVDLQHIFRVPPTFALPEIPEGSVGFVPNERIVSAIGKERALALYQETLKTLLDMGKPVFLLRHAEADRKLCSMILDSFRKDNRIIFLDRDFSCVEYNELVKRFQFIIASRFHAVVHAYKNGVPAVTIGWADKYKNLLESFGQGRFAFDVRSEINTEKLSEAVAEMTNCWPEESERIQKELRIVQEKNVFDVLNEFV